MRPARPRRSGRAAVARARRLHPPLRKRSRPALARRCLRHLHRCPRRLHRSPRRTRRCSRRSPARRTRTAHRRPAARARPARCSSSSRSRAPSTRAPGWRSPVLRRRSAWSSNAHGHRARRSRRCHPWPATSPETGRWCWPPTGSPTSRPPSTARSRPSSPPATAWSARPPRLRAERARAERPVRRRGGGPRSGRARRSLLPRRARAPRRSRLGGDRPPSRRRRWHPPASRTSAPWPCPTLPRSPLHFGPAQARRSWYMGLFQLPLVAEARLAANDFALVDRLWRDWSPGLPALGRRARRREGGHPRTDLPGAGLLPLAAVSPGAPGRVAAAPLRAGADPGAAPPRRRRRLHRRRLHPGGGRGSTRGRTGSR